MKFGVADFGMNVWDGGLYDIEERLEALKKIGYNGTERLEAASPSDALHKAVIYRKTGMDFATCRGPNVQAGIHWTAGLGKEYVWVSVGAKDFDAFCRQVNRQVEVSARFGVKVALHNHLNSPVETQAEVEEFMKRCPGAWIILDTAHLAGADGDALEIAKKYAERIVAMHLKDLIVLDREAGTKNFNQFGRFCELGAGNVGLDNAAILQAVVDRGFAGWTHIEQDTHLQDPLVDLKISREYLRKAGF